MKKVYIKYIYDTPDTYIGGIESNTVNQFIFQDNKIINKEIEIIPALLNIFNEFL